MSIRINDLTVRFKNGVVAVNKASLEIPKGIYGLLGTCVSNNLPGNRTIIENGLI
jgi:ABC-type Na+ transport system ATPase subunit NatA